MPPFRSTPTRSPAAALAPAFALVAGLLLPLAMPSEAASVTRVPPSDGLAGIPEPEVASGTEGETSASGGIQPGWVAFGTAIVYVLVLGRRSVTQLPPSELETESSGSAPPTAGESPP